MICGSLRMVIYVPLDLTYPNVSQSCKAGIGVRMSRSNEQKIAYMWLSTFPRWLECYPEPSCCSRVVPQTMAVFFHDQNIDLDRSKVSKTAAYTLLTLQILTAVRKWCVLCIFTGKCVPRDDGVQLFDIAAPNSGRNVVCFVHFDFEACNFSSLIWLAGTAPTALAGLLFDPPEPDVIGKTRHYATFRLFRASASSFFLRFLFYSSCF